MKLVHAFVISEIHLNFHFLKILVDNMLPVSYIWGVLRSLLTCIPSEKLLLNGSQSGS